MYITYRVANIKNWCTPFIVSHNRIVIYYPIKLCHACMVYCLYTIRLLDVYT